MHGKEQWQQKSSLEERFGCELESEGGKVWWRFKRVKTWKMFKKDVGVIVEGKKYLLREINNIIILK